MLTRFVLMLSLMQPQSSIAIKQSPDAQIAGECRQLQRLERIYSDADLGSPSVRDIPRGTIVMLAGEVNQPSAGWIRISSPAEGYILATFLAPCGSVAPQLAFPRPRLPIPLPNLPILPPPLPPPLRLPAPPPLPNPPSQLRLPLPSSPLPSPLPSPPDRPEP